MNRVTLVLLLACVMFLPASARAQGHMLHGIGPVNSSMGGAGTALPNESLGALMFNPALIAEVRGNQISFTTEFFRDGLQIDTTVGTLKGRQVPDNQLSVLPAFGWMMRDPSKRMALGFGLLAMAGFSTDYNQDDASILFAQPPGGFGRIYTDLRVTKIPVALAFEVTPKLSVGASLNVYLGEFAVAPLPYTFFDVDQAGNRWYEEAGALTKRFAAAAQFGFLYKASPKMAIGGSVTTPQNFKPYEWYSSNANPGAPNFGKASTTRFDLDGPLVVSFGTGLTPNEKTKIAVDGMYTHYVGVHGFGGPGGVIPAASTIGTTGGSSPGGVVDPFGWRNIWTFKAGAQHQATDKLAVRAGYNYSQMPLKPEAVLSATGAPATFQHHFTGGVGLRLFPFLEAEFSAYYVPRQHLVGPFLNLQNERVGTLDESNKLTSASIGLNFRF